jgi:DNA-binding NtrC family response regulator
MNRELLAQREGFVTHALGPDGERLHGDLCHFGRFRRMIGRSAPIRKVYDLVARVAPTDATVLIIGESGTGKELVAETLHRCSARKNGLLLPVNCGAVSPNLIESELFGHERGSFTGADRQRKGYFERATGGTLFLDEVTEMPIELQVKLLRVLESGIVVRVGGTEPVRVDVRIVAATSRDPAEAVKAGKLRADLYYRLNVFPIALPALRNRPGDVELLAEHFLAELNREAGTSKAWSRAALERLRSNVWTGNVRELRNVVQRAFILGDDEIPGDVTSLSERASVAPENDPVPHGPVLQIRVGSSIERVEQRLILATLEFTGGDKKKAAEILCISLKTLYNRLSLYAALRVASVGGDAPSTLSN